MPGQSDFGTALSLCLPLTKIGFPIGEITSPTWRALATSRNCRIPEDFGSSDGDLNTKAFEAEPESCCDRLPSPASRMRLYAHGEQPG